MPKSLTELKRQLSDIEPSERTYEGIGPADVESLRTLVSDPEPWLAARAVHALARIDAANARAAVSSAAKNPKVEVRVAAAAAASVLPAQSADDVLTALLDDDDLGVRKFAVSSASARNNATVRSKVAKIAANDATASLRQLASAKMQAMLKG